MKNGRESCWDPQMTWTCGYFVLSFHRILIVSSVSLALSPFCQFFSPFLLQSGFRMKYVLFKEFPGSRNPSRMVLGVYITGSWVTCPFPETWNRPLGHGSPAGLLCNLRTGLAPNLSLGMEESHFALVEFCPGFLIEILLFWPQDWKEKWVKAGM